MMHPEIPLPMRFNAESIARAYKRMRSWRKKTNAVLLEGKRRRTGLSDASEELRGARVLGMVEDPVGLALLDDDPAYNPNLTLDQGDYGLAFPPRSPKLRVAGTLSRH